ncbi:carbohydrate ABC transporter permease [Microlunatus speluncae]|uniref:carbohydrate ABC transporter permease n=1 Tax=Microlunatus speluncae TaxID=2594267 RepID=UPI0012664508|nr:carbohydrate ABC transporter permease [Microlunatus speluncae]
MTTHSVEARWTPATTRHRARVRTERIQWAGAYVILVLTSAAFLLPLLWMISTSLKSESAVIRTPPEFFPDAVHPENYPQAWSAMPFNVFLLNSIIVTALSMIGNLVSCILPAYAFARLRARLRGPMFLALLATMMIPAQVTLVPKYLLFAKLGWVDSYLPLVLPNFFGSALLIFLLRQFFTSIPEELVDSARVDGAGELRILWSIMLPLSRPAIATVTLLSFIGTWPEYLDPLIYLRSTEKFTIPLGIAMFRGQYDTQYHLMMAVSVLALIPIVITFLAAQKYFIRGITLTGLGGR